MAGGAAVADRTSAPVARAAGRALRLVSRHWALLLLLVVGGAVRALAVYAYVPAFSFPDSVTYLNVARTGQAEIPRPWAYSGLLAVLETGVPFSGVVVVQHVLGLLTAVLAYAFLQHRRVSRLISCLAVAPLLLDGYLVQIEHYVMAESLFVFLLVSALVLLLWSVRPRWWVTAAAGVLFGLGAVTRTVGVVVLAVVALHLIVGLIRRSVGWSAVVATGVGVLAVVAPYVLWFHSSTGVYALTDYTGHFLYGRVSNFADCEQADVPRRLEGLCPTAPPDSRRTTDWYVWDAASPANSGRYSEDDLTEFSTLILQAQPMDFVTSTASKTLHYFLPGRHIGQFDSCSGWWEFPDVQAYETDPCPARLSELGYGLEPTESLLRAEPAALLRRYQDWVHTPGPVLGLLALVGLAAVVPGRRPAAARDSLDAVLCVLVGVTLVAVPSATAVFDYRYGLPLLAALPIGAALATRRWTARPTVDERGDTVQTRPDTPVEA